MLKAFSAVANAIRTAVGGLLQIVGPTAGTTRTMTVPDANFTAAAGVPAAGLPLLPGACEVLRFTPGIFFSGFATVASTVFITPGQGL